MKKSSLEKITKAIESEIDAFGEVIDVSKFKELQKQLEKFVIRDALTMTLNRWKFEEVLRREISRARDDTHGMLGILMLDIDNFKKINDGRGHQEGDNVLQQVIWQAEFVVEQTIGKSHRLGRWGGDEFIYIFPHKSTTDIKYIAEDIVKQVNELYTDDVLSRPVTVSMGIAPLKKSDDSKTFINRADKAMYKAKKKGGNRIEISR